MAGHRQVISRISIQNTTVDCQGNSQGEGISVRAFALARPGVAPPLGLVVGLVVAV